MQSFDLPPPGLYNRGMGATFGLGADLSPRPFHPPYGPPGSRGHDQLQFDDLFLPFPPMAPPPPPPIPRSRRPPMIPPPIKVRW